MNPDSNIDFDPDGFSSDMAVLSERLESIADLPGANAIKEDLDLFQTYCLQTGRFDDEAFFGMARRALDLLMVHIDQDDVARFFLFFRQIHAGVAENAYGEWHRPLVARFIRFAGQYPFELAGQFRECDDHYLYSYFRNLILETVQSKGWKSMFQVFDDHAFLRSQEGGLVGQAALIQTLRDLPPSDPETLANIQARFSRYESLLKFIEKQFG